MVTALIGSRVVIVQRSLSNPAVGTDPPVQTVPAGRQWALLSFYGSLAASATVANRFPTIVMRNATPATLLQIVLPAAITASQTVANQFAVGLPFQLVGLQNLSPLPNHYWLDSGFSFIVSTTGLQAGDQWSQLAYVIAELVK